MSNSNVNKTILFIEKKKEFENNKDNNCFQDNSKKIREKNDKIISFASYKRLKLKKNHTKKENNLNINKIKKKVFLIVIVALFLLMFATTLMKQKSYSEAPSNSFVAESAQINSTESSTYKSIVKRVVGKYTNVGYNVTVSNLHKNGNLVYAQGYFDVPKEGKVNYDLILKNDSPISLIINGKEYIK